MPAAGGSTEDAALFQPPPPYKDEYEIVYSHALPHTTFRADPGASPSGAPSYRALTDQRRSHMRRVHDLLHLMLLRRDGPRAARCLRILMRAYEWRPLELFKLGMLVAGMPGCTGDRLAYLERISRTRTHLRPYVLPHLVLELIAAERYVEAREEMENVITSYPYRYNSQLHTYLGMLTLYMASRASGPSRPRDAGVAAEIPPEHAYLAQLPESARRAARHHFENSVKVSDRFMALHNRVLRQRLRAHADRSARLAERTAAHREQMWRAMRDDGWVFRGGDWEEEPAPRPTTPSPRKRRRRDENGESGDSDRSTDTRGGTPRRSRASSPDLVDIETELDTGFSSDESASPSASPSAYATDTVSEGPSLPDTVDVPPWNDAQDGDASPAPEEEDTNEDAPQPLAQAALYLPSHEWAVQAAHLYLELVRVPCFAARMLTTQLATPSDGRRAGARTTSAPRIT